ncbi:hypothetical protein FB45DRAFT_929958 [Roridomyces roridus]|uniref:Uncharacterized protein n=1 Tax=Roridomyces roridus TaxID=1738132 RepID=A0AAD7FHJ1_9AGAR|nr:hypothetical protein FB45DRAFT_929958 [Roridomyces roridus]
MRSLSLESYHDICDRDLSFYTWFTAPNDMQIQLGSIYYVPNWKLDGAFEIAEMPAVDATATIWSTEHAHVDDLWNPICCAEGTFISPESGWTRVDSACVMDTYSLTIGVSASSHKAWMAQASHIFASLEIQANRDEYAILQGVRVTMYFPDSPNDLPPGYLFLCPSHQFESHRWYQLPDCPAYWSVNPSGAERLTPEEAAHLGFPDFELYVKIYGLRWMDDMYPGMRQFHATKGYNPDTLDLATDLGYPFYELTCEKDELHTHVRNWKEENEPSASIELLDLTDETSSVVGEENVSVEDGVNELGEAESTQPSPGGMLIIYLQLALIGTCFALTLCGL